MGRHNHDALLWVDKYRTTKLSEMDVHRDLNKHIQLLCSSGDIPHLFLYGPPGGGKKTRMQGILNELFQGAADHATVSHRVFKLGETKKEVELTTVNSTHHMELNPSDVGNNDRLVIQEVIKEMASTGPIDVEDPFNRGGNKSAKMDDKEKRKARVSFRVVVLHDVDQMSRLAQQALRRTMEKYSKSCRIIMIASSATKVIEPLRSRCLGIRVPLPSQDECMHVLRSITRRENLVLNEAFGLKVVAASGGNMRRAILQLEASKSAKYPFTNDQEVTRADWEVTCIDIARTLMSKQAPHALLEIRTKLFELLCHAIPASIIFRTILTELLRNIDQDLAPKVLAHAAFYENRMQQGTKPIVHLEAFAARFMQIYKQFLSAMLDMDF